jgi:hypothetical protein
MRPARREFAHQGLSRSKSSTRSYQQANESVLFADNGENYVRHDEAGDRTVTREAYAAEIAKIRQERPTIRVVVYDHSFEGDRAWFRFAFKWSDPKTGEARSRAGMQSYRTEGGKLAETWLSLQPLGSTWSDAVAQEHWTSPPPIK